MVASLPIAMLAASWILASSPAPPAAAPAAPAAATVPPKPGPWNNAVQVHRLGQDGAAELLATFDHADVPTVAQLADGRIIAAFQGYPPDRPQDFNRVGVRFSSDGGRSWTAAQPIAITGMDAGLAPPFDPTLVPLPDGRVRLYFTSHPGSDEQPGQTAIHSAVSADGIHFIAEPGIRFCVEGRVVIDGAAALHGGKFHLIVPDNGTPSEFLARRQAGEPPIGGNGYHATSVDGLTFERAADLPLTPVRNRWFGNLQSDGRTLSFFGTGPGPWPMTSADGFTWNAAPNPMRMPGVDPAVLALKDGARLVLSTRAPGPATNYPVPTPAP
jgi:hypothetical protein